jgi:DNA-binding transcriptional LysR family regulator
LLQQHAGLSVDLVHESTLDLVHDAVDLAIRLGSLPTDSTFVVRRIGSVSQAIVGAPAYLDANPPLTHPTDLAQHHCIIDDRATHREVWTMTGPDGTIEAHVGGRFRTDNSDSKHEAVLSGLGLATLSKWLVRHELRRGTLRVVLPEWQFAPILIHAIYPSKRNLPPRVRAVLDFLIDEMSNIPELSETILP